MPIDTMRLAQIAQIRYVKDGRTIEVTFVGRREVREGRLVFWDQSGALHSVRLEELKEGDVRYGYFL
jgi:hypothetical protein